MRLLPIIVLSLAPLAHAVTSGAVIAVIKDVTTMSDQLRIEVQGITLFNAGKQGFVRGSVPTKRDEV
jgi:type III secretory pathway component EscS